MAAIAEVITGAVSGLVQAVTGSITQGVTRANELYTERVLGVTESRNKSSSNRTLALTIVAALVLIIIGGVLIRKK